MRGRTAVLGAMGVATVAGIIELLPRVGIVRPQDLPPTSAILRELASLVAQGGLWQTLYDTAYVWGLGLAVATVTGIGAGIAIGSVPVLRRATSSTVEFLRPIPSVALVPLVVLLFGPRYASALVLVVYASFWQVLIQTIYGVADIDPVAEETVRSYRFSPLARVRHLVWPTALPYVMTGFRLAATVALVLTVTAQLIIGTPGIGQQIALAESAGASARMYALVLVTGLLGLVVNLAARAVERRVLAWHPSVRGEVSA